MRSSALPWLPPHIGGDVLRIIFISMVASTGVGGDDQRIIFLAMVASTGAAAIFVGFPPQRVLATLLLEIISMAMVASTGGALAGRRVRRARAEELACQRVRVPEGAHAGGRAYQVRASGGRACQSTRVLRTRVPECARAGGCACRWHTCLRARMPEGARAGEGCARQRIAGICTRVTYVCDLICIAICS